MVLEWLVSNIADNLLDESDVGERIHRGLNGDQKKKAFKHALQHTFERFELQYPQLAVEGLFDESFFSHQGASLLAQTLMLDGHPNPSDLASHWADSLNIKQPERRTIYVRELEAAAADFLDYLSRALRAEADLRDIFESQALERSFSNSDTISSEINVLRKNIKNNKATPGTLRDYLHWLIERNYYLDPRGTFQTQRQVQVKLEEIYIPLNVQRDVQLIIADNYPQEKDSEEFGTKFVSANMRAEDAENQQEQIIEAIGRHDSLVLLGHPGSGKTTLLRYLALKYAQGLGNDQKTVEPGLGTARIPILVRIADYAEYGLPYGKSLSEFLSDYCIMHECPQAGLADLFAVELSRGSCIVLLDGIDEVVSQDERLAVVQQIEDFVRLHRLVPNRFIITSRIVGYRQSPLSSSFVHYSMQEMDEFQIRCFLEAWCPAVELAQTPELPAEIRETTAKHEINSIMQAVQNASGVRRLAANPLFLRILALIHRTGARLPQKRIELYKLVADTLTRTWRSAQGVPESALVSEEYLIPLLSKLAYWLHVNKTTGIATEHEVYGVLGEELARINHLPWNKHEPDSHVMQEVKKFLLSVREHTGLFVEQGPRLYGFLNLPFEEYYTARFMVARIKTRAKMIRQHLHDPRWDEPILLALDFVGLESPTEASELLETAILAHGEEAEVLGFTPSPYESTLGRDYLFALRCLGDDIPANARLTQRLIERLVDDLLHPANSSQHYQQLLWESLKYLKGSMASSILSSYLTAALNDINPNVLHLASESLRIIGFEGENAEVIRDLDANRTSQEVGLSKDPLGQKKEPYLPQEQSLKDLLSLPGVLKISNFTQFAQNFISHLADVCRLPTINSTYSSNEWFLGAINIAEIFTDLVLPSPILVLIFRRDQSILVPQDLDEMRHLISQYSGHNCKIAMLILFGEDASIKEAQSLLSSTMKGVYAYDIITPTRSELLQLLTPADSRRSMRRLLLTYINLSTISPYKTLGPTSDRIFFGRDKELREIEEHITDKSYALIGGRRIGKTSILHRLLRERLKERFRPFFFSCQSMDEQNPTKHDFLAAIIKNWQLDVRINPGTTFADVISQLTQKKPIAFQEKPLVILIDEADRLVPSDQQVGWPLFGEMRALAEELHCQFVFAGEHGLNAAMNDAHSPFHNFAAKLLIGRLDKAAVAELVTQPMRQLEIKLANRQSIVDRIYEFTSGHPNIVQRLCQRLINLLDHMQSRRITLVDVENVIALPAFQKEDFLDTFWERATTLEKIISLVMTQNSNRPYTLRDIRQALNVRLALQPKAREIDQSLRRLTDLRNILMNTSDGYIFAVKAFPLVIANTVTKEDLFEVLVEEYLEFGDVLLWNSQDEELLQ